MADMGFLPAVKRILDMTSSDRQTILFSATLDGDVAVLTQRYQPAPFDMSLNCRTTTRVMPSIISGRWKGRIAPLTSPGSSLRPAPRSCSPAPGMEPIGWPAAGGSRRQGRCPAWGAITATAESCAQGFRQRTQPGPRGHRRGGPGHSRRRRCQCDPFRSPRGREDLCAPFGADRPCRGKRNGGLTRRREPGQECPEIATSPRSRLRNGRGTPATHAQGASSLVVETRPSTPIQRQRVDLRGQLTVQRHGGGPGRDLRQAREGPLGHGRHPSRLQEVTWFRLRGDDSQGLERRHCSARWLECRRTSAEGEGSQTRSRPPLICPR